MTQPVPQVAQHLSEPQELTQQAAGNDHHQGTKKEVGAQNLPTHFLAADGLGEQQAARYICCRHPEHGQLQMPGAGEVTRQQP